MDLFFFFMTTPLGPLVGLPWGRVYWQGITSSRTQPWHGQQRARCLCWSTQDCENGGLCAVRDHVDVRGLPDSRSVREVDGLVVVTHGQVPAENVMAQ